MTYVRTKREPKGDNPKPHVGFDSRGHVIRSETRVDNAVTRITWEIVTRIRTEMLTPAEVCWDIAHRPDFYRDLFYTDVLASWAGLERWDQWPHALASGSLMQTLKQHGREAPPWFDENAWAAACDLWERNRGAESRYAVALKSVDALRSILGDELAERAKRVLSEVAARGR